MYLNLIVPCGISQLTNVSDKVAHNKWKPFLEKLRSSHRDTAKTAYESDEAVMLKKDLLEKINLSKMDNNQDGLLGGELSTLLALQTRTSPRTWKPMRDFITLFVTETYAGNFAADILKNALITYWGVPSNENHLSIKSVSGWQPNLSKTNAEAALGNLATDINVALRESKTEDPIYNVLVATGGMRSTLPCLTIYSLLYGFELVCLSEESTDLLELRPAQEGSEKKIPWDKVLIQRGRGGSMLQSYIRKAFDFYTIKKGIYF